MISAAGQVPTPDTQARCADLIFEHEGRVIRLEEEVEGCRDTYRLRKTRKGAETLEENCIMQHKQACTAEARCS